MRKLSLWMFLGLAAVVLVSFNVQAQDHAYVGAAKCKMCHKVQYASWEETVHAKATDNAKASTEREFSADCLKCHATNADEAMAGVQCEACHGAGADYKKMSIMKDLEAATANGLVIPSQETCDGCHTGDDHAKKVVKAENLDNKKAIHEFKNPPGE
ncbi:MAG: multiheme c-type cytochrome [Thermoanaerobaculales bacterium]